MRSRWEQFNENSDIKARKTTLKQQFDDEDANAAALLLSPQLQYSSGGLQR